MIDQGLFVTPKVDVTTLESFKSAASTDTAELVEILTGHGRYKRPQFLAWSSITAIRQNSSTGSIEIECGEKSVSVTVPDRDRLDKLGRVLAKALSAQSSAK